MIDVSWGWFLGGLFVGANVGLVLFALMRAAADNRRRP